MVLSKVSDPWRIKNFDLAYFSITFLQLFIKRMNFEKNVVEYNLFVIKLSWKKIRNQFFVWLPITEKIACNWEKLDFAHFWCLKSSTDSVVKINISPTNPLRLVSPRLDWLAFSVPAKMYKLNITYIDNSARFATMFSSHSPETMWH